MRYVVVALCVLLPDLAVAKDTIKVVTYRKPRIYITHREACLQFPFERYGALMTSDLVRDMGDAIEVRCHFVK